MHANHEIESIFSQAIGLTDPVRRGTYLDQACEGDAGLRNRVSALLAANQNATSFMSEPAGILPDDIEENLEQPIGEQPGDHIGRYKLLQQIGEGGMGTVFMAEQQEPVRRKVALKVIKPGLDTKEVIARFESERQALALMNHPNIAGVLDAGATQQGRPYFVMELVKGIAINEYCNEAKLTARERLNLFVDVCHAIQHAHQKGIIHRDIKPRNVMITLDGDKAVPKVIDFGIAKAIDQNLTSNTLFTRYGEFIGTPAYMSPEQAALSVIDVDTRSDVYSLGALLYELLADVPPFDSEQLKPLGHDEMRRFICEITPVQPSDVIDTVGGARATTIAQARGTTPRELKSLLNGELDWIVMRALEKERSRRYDTPIALADDVERYLRNDAVVARPTSTAYRARKFVAKNRTSVTAACAIAVTLLVATCVSGWLAFNAIRSEARANDETKSLREVVGFINGGLFSNADPLQEPNRNIKLRTVLDRAAQQLDAKSIERPSVEAAIRTTIGETYRGLGEYELALLHLKRAHQLCVDEFSDHHPKTIEATNRFAAALLASAKYNDAKALIDQNILVAQRELTDNDPLLLEAMKLSAVRFEAAGELTQAENLFRDLLGRRESTLGVDHPKTCRAMANLASVYQSQGRFNDALQLLQASHAGMMQTDSDWPTRLNIAASLAALHSARKEKDIAAKIYEETIPHAERVLGSDHVQTLTAKHGLAVVRFSQHRLAEAELLLEEVFEGQRRQLGEEHPGTLTTMHNLAMLRQSQGRFSEAEVLLKTELQNRRLTLGDDHASIRNALSGLAFFYLNQAEFAKAIPYYEQATAALRQVSNDEPNVVASLTMLALCRNKTGAGELAKADLQVARQICESTLPDQWLQFVVESLLGEVHLGLGNRNDAEAALLLGYDGLKIHEQDVPAHWKPLGLRAATRRLAEFYESSDDSELQARAVPYRDELESLRTNSRTNPPAKINGKTRKSEDGNPN